MTSASAPAADVHASQAPLVGWDAAHPERHFVGVLRRLARGEAVLADYSTRHFVNAPDVQVPVEVHIVCDPAHADYPELLKAGLLSSSLGEEAADAVLVGGSPEGQAAALDQLIRSAHDPTARVCQIYDVSGVLPRGSMLSPRGELSPGPLALARMLQRVGKVLWAACGDRLDGIDALEIDDEIAQAVSPAGGCRPAVRTSVMHGTDPMLGHFLRLHQSGPRTTCFAIDFAAAS